MTTLPDGRYIMTHRDGGQTKQRVIIKTIDGTQVALGIGLHWKVAALIRIGYQFERVDDNATD